MINPTTLVPRQKYTVETIMEGRPAWTHTAREHYPAVPDLPLFRRLTLIEVEIDTGNLLFEEERWVNDLDPHDPSYAFKFIQGGLTWTRGTRFVRIRLEEIVSVRKAA